MTETLHGVRGLDWSQPYGRLEPVTPNDGTDLPGGVTRGVFIGSQGPMVVIDMTGNQVTFANMPIGLYPLRVTRVLATGTTASSIVACY